MWVSASHKTMSSPDPKHTESFSPLPKAPHRIQDLLLSTCMERQTCRHCSCVVEYPAGTAARYANILLDKHLENCHSMVPRYAVPPDNIIEYRLTVAPRASTSTSPSIPSQYLLDDMDATSTLVGESAMTSPSLSSNETISLPDETNETNAIATPSTVGSPVSSKKSRLNPQRREMNETRRRINLEEDLYTTDVRPKSVQCTACLREISLDKRWKYYDYPWRKHRRTCLMIRIAESQRLQNEAIRNDAFFPETARPAPQPRSPGEALRWIQVEGLGTVGTTRRAKKRPHDSSEDPVPRTGRRIKRLKGCDD